MINRILDTLSLVRAVLTLKAQNESLSQQAAEQEERADIAEAAAEEYRSLYLRTEDTIRGLEKELHRVQKREELGKALLRALLEEARALHSAALHDLAIYQHNAAQRKQIRVSWRLRSLAWMQRALECSDALTNARSAADCAESQLKEEVRRRKEAERQLEEIQRLSPGLSTAQVKERLHLSWEAINAHGGLPIGADEGSGP